MISIFIKYLPTLIEPVHDEDNKARIENTRRGFACNKQPTFTTTEIQNPARLQYQTPRPLVAFVAEEAN